MSYQKQMTSDNVSLDGKWMIMYQCFDCGRSYHILADSKDDALGFVESPAEEGESYNIIPIKILNSDVSIHLTLINNYVCCIFTIVQLKDECQGVIK